MCESLLSVGLDVGTTTTQMIVSKLAVENRASAFSVPKMEIVDREILYRGQVRFTPLLGEDLVDAPKLGQMIRREYELAGITREDVDTGAVIITGETSRKENAKAVLEQISDLAGEFVVATAGPDLESVLAAKGAGAVQFSKDSGKRVLHMDIGGGTTNLALIEDGRILRTGCLNVGGRLIKLDEDGNITYVSPVLKGISSLKVGDKPEKQELEELAKNLARVLEGAAGWGEEPLLGKLVTREARPWQPPEGVQGISFSGGVADCIAREIPWLSFGDLGPLLGQAIRESCLCAGEYRLGTETIRATVIGAGCHATSLSGSTVFCRNVTLPMKNLPVMCITRAEQESAELPQILKNRLETGETVMIAMPGPENASYGQLEELGNRLAKGLEGHPVYLCLEADMAKALGQILALRLGLDVPILCIDRLKLEPESYLDVGTPVGPAFPVVIKTLILSQ